jgi:hypothetical protein
MTRALRVHPAEIGLSREVLRHRLGGASRETLDELPVATPPQASTDDALGLACLLERAATPVSPGQPRVTTGSTPVLGRVVCAVADAANNRYADTLHRSDEAPDLPRAEQLLVAPDTADACLATVLDLARVCRDASGRARVSRSPAP